MSARRITLLLLSAALLCGARTGVAHPAGEPDLAFQPHPGAQLPPAARLADEAGNGVALGQYFTGRPVILVFGYLRCRTLCGVLVENIVGALGSLPLEPVRDFQFVDISIDPRDQPADAVSAKARYLRSYDRPKAAAGMHFLTGSVASVRRIADAAGFPYRYDPAGDEYIHPAGFAVATGSGAVSRYVEGVGVTPAILAGALADAQQHRALGPVARLLLLCRSAAAPLGRFTLPVLAALTFADLAAALTLIGIFTAIRRRRHD